MLTRITANWAGMQGEYKDHTVSVWSPDMREGAEFVVTAPSPEWAAIQAVAVAFEGDPVDLAVDDTMDIFDHFPSNLTLTVDGVVMADYMDRLSKKVDASLGFIIAFN